MSVRQGPDKFTMDQIREHNRRMVEDVARFTCECGHWLMIPKGVYTEESPLVCKGMCHVSNKCDRKYYWKDNKLVMVDPDGNSHTL